MARDFVQESQGQNHATLVTFIIRTYISIKYKLYISVLFPELRPVFALFRPACAVELLFMFDL